MKLETELKWPLLRQAAVVTWTHNYHSCTLCSGAFLKSMQNWQQELRLFVHCRCKTNRQSLWKLGQHSILKNKNQCYPWIGFTKALSKFHEIMLYTMNLAGENRKIIFHRWLNILIENIMLWNRNLKFHTSPVNCR